MAMLHLGCGNQVLSRIVEVKDDRIVINTATGATMEIVVSPPEREKIKAGLK